MMTKRNTENTHDPAERIIDLMSDGRERTFNDIAVKLKMSPDLVRDHVMALSRHGKGKRLQSTKVTDQGHSISIWRAV